MVRDVFRPRRIDSGRRPLAGVGVVACAVLLGLPPRPALAARERTGSLDAFVVLDESGSMKPIFERVTAFLADALVRDYLEPEDYLCLIGFSDAPCVRVSQRVSSPAEKENLAAIVKSLNVVPQGYTDMGRALEKTLLELERLADPSHQQVILILTDGLNQPPRDSVYYDPIRPDGGAGLAPPSGFGARFKEQVARLAAKGYRVHVVGIGSETDAQRLAEALGAGYTLLARFDADELRRGLGRFWDETVNLVAVDAPAEPWRPGSRVSLAVRLQSTCEKEREVRLGAGRIASLTRLTPGGPAGAVPDPAALAVTLATTRLSVPARQDVAFEAAIDLPRGFPSGDYRATIAFEQRSAVRFYPPQAEIGFHVPSFWEMYGRRIVVALAAAAALLVVGVLYRRRAIGVGVIVEGDPAAAAPRPVRFAIGVACSVGGSATDRFRIAGLPPKVAILERRSVDRFALISSHVDVIPTVPEYRLGDPVEIRLGRAPEDRRVARFTRAKARPPSVRVRPPRPARPSAPASGGTPGGIDFR
jgi:Mg-chelatase subunit ChlD